MIDFEKVYTTSPISCLTKRIHSKIEANVSVVISSIFYVNFRNLGGNELEGELPGFPPLAFQNLERL